MESTTSVSTQRNAIVQTGVFVSLVSIFVIFLVVLIFTGKIGLAVVFAVLGLIVLLISLTVTARFLAPSGHIKEWMSGTWDIAEQDIDPGLELLAAGMLVYRMGEVRPQIHFRKVPLGDARAIRPFIVARTGAERPHQFQFLLTDDKDKVRFDSQFTVELGDAPKLIMPPFRLAPDMPRKLVGQCWSLQVRSRVVVVTSFRFMFIDRAERLDSLGGVTDDPADQALDRHHDLLPDLLTEEIKREVMVTTQEIILEDL